MRCSLPIYASAELGCFLALNWPMPVNVLDLFIEFRESHQRPADAGGVRSGRRLGLFWHRSRRGGREGRNARARPSRRTVVRGRTRSRFFDYCESDVIALERLLPAMLPRIDLPRALLRGRYMKAAAAMEWNGTPIDTATLALLREYWTDIQDELIRTIDADYASSTAAPSKPIVGPTISLETASRGRGSNPVASICRMTPSARWQRPIRSLRRCGSCAARYPTCALTTWLSVRTAAIAQSCRPSVPAPAAISRQNTRFIFGPSVWLRSLIKPPPGHGLAYIDWSQQEFGIAAALSGDVAMQEAYSSGDPYLAFAKQASAVPADATKQSHGPTRELFKQCVLAVAYGMEAPSLAYRIGQPPIVARDLLRAHRETYQSVLGAGRMRLSTTPC